MEDKQLIISNNNLCRTCMSTGTDLISLYNVINVINNKQESLDSVLSKCTSVEITKNDTFPQHICSICLERLTSAYLFRELCLETDYKFKQLYNQAHHSYYVSINKVDICELSESFPKQQDRVESKLEHERLDSNSEEYDDNDVDVQDFDNLDASQSYSNVDDIKEQSPILKPVPKYNCDICDRSFVSKYAMHRHRRIHSNCKDLKCSICGKQFTRSYDVKRHMTTHNGDKPYNCVICEASFTQSGTLAIHIRQHEEFPQMQDKKVKRVLEERSHLCSLCGKSFKQSSALTIHIRRHLGDKPYQCKYCSLSFVSSGRLTSHIRVHTGERPFVCNICGKNFAQSSVISKHMKTHTGDKPYNCGHCLKSFTTSYSLNIHKRIHTGEKPHECTVCHKRFADPKNLKQHKQIHSGDKPFLCIICGKCFTRSHHLKGHMLNVHSKNG